MSAASAGRRVLVIEDNPQNLELVSDLLEMLDLTVEHAGTAEEGLEMAWLRPPDLILLDIRLPGIDGHEAVRRLKADARTSSVPTLALTAQAMTGDEAKALEAGFDAYVTKPIDTRAFPATIATHLGDARDRG